MWIDKYHIAHYLWYVLPSCVCIFIVIMAIIRDEEYNGTLNDRSRKEKADSIALLQLQIEELIWKRGIDAKADSLFDKVDSVNIDVSNLSEQLEKN